jgi:heme exporter protein A
VDKASLWRGERCLFTDLDFSLGNGESALVTGPNGAGKTSLLRMLAGFCAPATGTVRLNNEPIQRLTAENRAPIHYHGHADGLKPDLSVTENLKFYCRVARGRFESQPLAALGLMAHAERPVRRLSAGQRRRVALCLLQLCPAPLWLLDEPFTHLDADGRALVERWLGEHLRAGGIAVIATHQPVNVAGSRQLRIEL